MNHTHTEEYKELLLSKLACELRNAYYRHARVKNAKARSAGRISENEKESWRRVAEVVDRLGTTPELYIEAQFAMSQSKVWINALHGPNAQRLYRMYVQTKHSAPIPVKEDEEDLPKMNHSILELKDSIADTYRSLAYYCGGTDFHDPAVLEKAKEIATHFDPLCMLILRPQQDFMALFGRQAKRKLDNNPSLRKAAIECGFDIVIDYIDEMSGKEDIDE